MKVKGQEETLDVSPAPQSLAAGVSETREQCRQTVEPRLQENPNRVSEAIIKMDSEALFTTLMSLQHFEGAREAHFQISLRALLVFASRTAKRHNVRLTPAFFLMCVRKYKKVHNSDLRDILFLYFKSQGLVDSVVFRYEKDSAILNQQVDLAEIQSNMRAHYHLLSEMIQELKQAKYKYFHSRFSNIAWDGETITNADLLSYYRFKNILFVIHPSLAEAVQIYLLGKGLLTKSELHII